ncbi:acyl-CoA dehydrogenase family protein [Mycolicibacterium sphagni]|uniref:Acyl-CoA dehydrogenase n=1 Tax=Mycolicibacterium sphagni TaxID=1786 RepID=A0A255DC81_9MYCO|nr:acyl-CoA dehydrogenase family protein [Mycolicibacterium sphagni]MCV7175384.1 acyl-CoA dehydrogenase [Mycolicibacterium sphagni]OYN76710.1 acyl-CoA dehydrogenase [Mycolicibacterium sphagni]
METSLPEHIREFGRVAHHRFATLGGPQESSLPAERDGSLRELAAAALAEIGATELDVRNDAEDRLAGAVVARAAGAVLLPYPVVDDLMAIDGARLSLVDPRIPRVDHGDLAGPWLLADLDGIAYTATLGPRHPAKLGPFLVRATDLSPVNTVPRADLALHLIMQSWRILGALERALEITCDHVKARTQFGKTLSEFQFVRFTVADASVTLRGLEELAKFSLSRWAPATDAIGWTDALMLKIKAAEAGIQLMRTSHQLLGALGFCDESDISVIDRHLQPALRLPESVEALALRLAPEVGAGHVETLFS